MNTAPRPNRHSYDAAPLGRSWLGRAFAVLRPDGCRCPAWSRIAACLSGHYGEQFVEAFYAHLLAFDETGAFLQDPDLVARLKKSQREHFESMLAAEWTPEYVPQRFQVGEVHAEAGIDPEHFLALTICSFNTVSAILLHASHRRRRRLPRKCCHW